MTIATWATPAILGMAFHASLQFFEADFIVPQTAAALGVAGLAGLYVDSYDFENKKSLLESVVALLTFTTIFLTTLAICTIVYRLFFHRLRKFPGPVGAKISKFYSLWLSRNIQYHFEVEKLHKKYGDVVRTGPRELSIARISPLSQIMTCGKGSFYGMAETRIERQGLPFKMDPEDHRRGRRAWEISMTPQQITRYNPAMQDTISLFLNRLSEEKYCGKPVNVTNWISWLGYDIMGVVGFGRDFDCLRKAIDHPAIKQMHEFGFALGLLKHVPWLGNILGRMPGGQTAMEPYARYCRDLVREKMKTLHSIAEKPDAPTDILTWLIQAYEEKKPWGALTIEALDDDTRSLVMAGADTATATMANFFYYLAKYPEIQQELYAQIKGHIPENLLADPHTLTSEVLDRVPLLEPIINETLRLQPPIPSGNPRVTPPEGLYVRDAKYGDISIPGNIVVYMPQWVIQHDERYFKRPYEFIPTRWIAGSPDSSLLVERSAWFPFQVGTYYCVGQKLAIWELKSVLARTIAKFEVCFAQGEDGESFINGSRDQWTLTLAKLMLYFKKRL
ncbi:cytochrome p450 [Neofusicoccum parvum]|uniref:Cytochrome p450 n=1 Tax=Neofusicoccum parvum TaxID=310453 RepID=A0ACB5SF43_9PEZI|nr:cytochrome p450 [Neofusicoccum parvum]GME56040.1 cytochrome p450 [Neofusicoccum parvum]